MTGATSELRKWWEGAVLREGLLPLAVSAIPILVKTLFPKNDIAEVATFLLVPTSAALIRTAIAVQQLRNAYPSKPPMTRQLALAAAIILLLVYEGLVTLFSFANDEPTSAWICAFCFYLGYLIAIWFAFYSARGAQID